MFRSFSFSQEASDLFRCLHSFSAPFLALVRRTQETQSQSQHVPLMLQTLKRIPPTASYHREELGSERSSHCSRSHSEQVAEKMDLELVTCS